MMKAFQIKIAVKNAKPPVWRRMILPAGITFSQLSVILNKALGRKEEGDFRFEFYHLELCILEGADRFSGGFGTYDSLEASNTYIREYLEENPWFNYLCGVEGQEKYRVDVEQVIDDHEENYAKVIKYKGECPVSGEGEVLPNYDLEAVNDDLRTKLYYQWGKGEKRSQRQIVRALQAGSYGL